MWPFSKHNDLPTHAQQDLGGPFPDRGGLSRQTCAVGTPPQQAAKPRPKVATVVLTWAEASKLIPALEKHGRTVPTPSNLAEIYDTLLNSVVMPPPPWPQYLVRFTHVISLPAGAPLGSTTPFFIFYPL